MFEVLEKRLTYVVLERVRPNPWNTRQEIDADHVADLAGSIQQNGLLQAPLGRLIIPDTKTGEIEISSRTGLAAGDCLAVDPQAWVELAFGHHRLEAIKKLVQEGRWSWNNQMPIELRPLSDIEMADFAWEENRHKPVNPVDRALAIQRQINDFGWTQQDVAARRGFKDHSTVANLLSLLRLPDDVQADLRAGRLSLRQGQALVRLYNLHQVIRGAGEAEILSAAREGASSDRLREKIDACIDRQTVELKHDWPLEHVFVGASYQAARCSECALRLQRGSERCGDSKCLTGKTMAWQAGQLPGLTQPIQDKAATIVAPVYESVEDTPSSPLPQPERIEDAPATPLPEPEYIGEAPAPEAELPAERPEVGSGQAETLPAETEALGLGKIWDNVSVAAAITWWPVRDGLRSVALALRVDQRPPTMRMLFAHEAEISNELQQVLHEMLADARRQIEA